MTERMHTTRVAIAGGGPAGIMLGYLLARAGVDVIVLEKWPDFFRDFRGDTIHPSTMQVLHELGLLERFLALPHQKTRQMVGHFSGTKVVMADFSMLRTRCPYIAFIPQWDFLNFMVSEARQYPHFHIMMQTDAIDIMKEGDRVVGIRAKDALGEFAIRADLVIGADGRHSTIREKSGLVSDVLGVPIDVLWFRLSQPGRDPEQSLGYIDAGKVFVMLDRGDYWQCGFIIEKGEFEHIKSRGLESFRNDIATLVPFTRQSVGEITDWEQVKLLSVTVDHLKTWHAPGLLMIGDAAHAMSPLGGVGINLAIQDAVAAANVLVPAFKSDVPRTADLERVQHRREMPTRWTQRVQILLQNRALSPMLAARTRVPPPLFFRLLRAFPPLRYFPARFMGIGFRPEHIRIDF